MRAVVQRVRSASVEIDSCVVGKIEHGLLILLGVEDNDTADDINWLSRKIVNLRIFSDEAGAMNRSLLDVGGQCLVVSQFTLFGSYKKVNRPSFLRAAAPSLAIPLYEQFVKMLAQLSGRSVPTGRFGADMQVSLVNDGPVTLCLDTHAKE